jgi:hypothetical protein
MAQAANVVKFKRSAVAGKVPATADLALGELALNTYDGRIYLKKSVASVESIVTIQQVTAGTGVAVSTGGVVSIGQSVATTADVTFNSVSFPDETTQTTAWTGILQDPTYSGSSSIGNVTPAPLNLNNTGSSGENKTQLTLINTAGGGGTGSSIDFFTYTDAGNSLPGARLQAIDDSGFSANFSIVLKERYQSGNGQAGATWTFNADGTTQFPGYKFPSSGGTTGQILSLDSYGNLIWVTSGVTSSGTVTSVSVVSTNGFAGTVATSTTTPAITIKTTVTGLLKGNGTSVSAATSGTDYLAPGSLSITTNSAGSESLSYSNGVFTFTPADLSSYVTSSSLSSSLSSYVTSISLSSTLGSYVTSSSLSSTLSSYVTSSTLSSYNYITLTSLSMDTPGAASGSGSVAYSNTTGKFKYTPPDLSSYITASVTALTSLTSIGATGVDTTTNGNLIVSGNLTVNGTTETINATTSTFADKNIELAKPVSPATASDAGANGGGITLHGTTDKTLNWVLSTTAWTSSENVDLASSKTYKINGTNVLSSTALGSGVTSSSLTSVGTLTNLTVTNTITGSISGNAGTVTNGVYTTGSYSDPSWITSLSYSKLTSAPTNVSAFTNDAGYITSSVATLSSLTSIGAVGTITTVYNPKVNGTLRDNNNSVGTAGYVLQSTGTGVQWTSPAGASGGTDDVIFYSLLMG